MTTRTRQHQREHGYMLVMTLLLVALAGTALAAVARGSLREAVTATRALDDLQRRWAVRSCQTTLLVRAEDILLDAEAQRIGPVPALDVELRLNGEIYHVVLADEQAKANVNTIHTRLGDEQTRYAVTELLAASHAQGRALLRPRQTGHRQRDADDAERTLISSVLDQQPAFGCFAQILSPPPSATDPMRIGDWLAGRGDFRAAASRHLTCWGDGRVQIRRASRQVLQSVCLPLLDLGQVQAILDIRSTRPGLSVAQALEELELKPEQRSALMELLTTESRCHSLWVSAQADQRRWHHLRVRERLAGSRFAEYGLTWQ